MGTLRETIKDKMNKKEKVLVVGGAGYIFGLTSDLLIRDGFDVTVYDNLSYEERFLKDINFINGDIRDTEKLFKIALGYDIIILASALVGDPACSVNPEISEEINYNSIVRFCNKLKEKQIDKHLIFMSTCSVYGAQDGMLNEESDTNPLSVYASTKLRAEKYIKELGGTIFRLGTVFGLGDSYSRLRMDLVVNVMTMKAIKYGKLSVNGGEQWRPIIAVKDIAEYVVEACKRKPNDTFVLAYENTTIKELGEKVSQLIPGTKIEYTEMNFQDARNYKVDNSKSLAYFNYKPQVSVEDEVLRMKTMFEEGRIKNGEDSNYHNGIYLKNKKEQGINY